MSDRNIQCKKCSTDLGVIRDARLRKDTTYFCGQCSNDNAAQIKKLEGQIRSMRLARTAEQAGGGKNDTFNDMFGDIFGKR